MSRILVVEDEALIAVMIEEWLGELGCICLGPAATVASAIALIDQAPPDGVILDVSLGRETSFGVADRLTTMFRSCLRRDMRTAYCRLASPAA